MKKIRITCKLLVFALVLSLVFPVFADGGEDGKAILTRGAFVTELFEFGGNIC